MNAIDLAGAAELVVPPGTADTVAELVEVIVVPLVCPVGGHKGIAEQAAFCLEKGLLGMFVSLVFMLVLRGYAYADAEDGGPGNGKCPARFSADGVEAVITQEPAVDQCAVHKVPAMHMNGVLQAEAAQIATPAEFQTTRQVLDLAEPFLELAVPVVRGAVVVEVVGAEALQILTCPQGGAKLEALDGPAIALRVMVAGSEVVHIIRRGAAVHALEVHMREEESPNVHALPREPIDIRLGGGGVGRALHWRASMGQCGEGQDADQGGSLIAKAGREVSVDAIIVRFVIAVHFLLQFSCIKR